MWENGNGKPGHEFDIQDEFMSFQRTQTTVPLANHIIQWNYDFTGKECEISTSAPTGRSLADPRNPERCP